MSSLRFFRQTVKLLLNNKPRASVCVGARGGASRREKTISAWRLSHISFDELGARDQVHSSSLSA